ncbi:TPA: HK97 family phage prohead protease [Pseudomonas aeruginosa]|uniref:HK97 family phage prohead protease n=1 Tax=Pseudomonas aeruginosa TaxID=287 RepID=UPI000F73DF0B|nr:HK97 family phage prohead protease [Pseudomonas aeruginosa]EIU5573151.1 HK97 family phage prohead protease [Pseudomonas aeruginosa]MCU9051241.1 HK97 family phage prohead protease [Pseudomonas aeruginosa]MCU9062541.1 HK97 family phage prohead protease [Pseudomonas aeruginosa]MCU9112097.1 HK97 family phage prohead protease [Pseudomonas aeruginosa]MCU9125205.1 HK97 family phage prohead protease [Pseudomonas aeruginosa]
MERRAFGIEQKGRTLTGYAARFNSEANIGDFVEVIRPGAFARTLAAPSAVNIRAIYEHDDKALLGRVGAGTLRLSEDDNGLAFELDLPDTTHGRDLAELVKRGDVAGCSFGFMVAKDSWLPGPLRELRDVDLIEITLTARPAYDSTSVSLRSLAFGRLNLARRYLEAVA